MSGRRCVKSSEKETTYFHSKGKDYLKEVDFLKLITYNHQIFPTL